MNRLPTLHVVGDSIPQAYFRAIQAVWQNGLPMSTQYDRRDGAGNLIDPPSRDARVLIEVKDPFAQPRFPPISFCEIGTYMAELCGLKDYKVLPMSALKVARDTGELESSEWPYTYHQRLFAHPDLDGDEVDQVRRAVELVAQTPYTRRAMCSTPVPNIDPFLKEDIPCLRELQLRCVEDENGDWVLNATTMWRSRDLYKAWGDNVIAITFLLQIIAYEIAKLSGKNVRVGSYADFSCSLHIYGQDFGALGGDPKRGLQSFFETFDEERFITRSLPSEFAKDMLVLPQLEGLTSATSIHQWGFPPDSIRLLKALIAQIKNDKLIV